MLKIMPGLTGISGPRSATLSGTVPLSDSVLAIRSRSAVRRFDSYWKPSVAPFEKLTEWNFILGSVFDITQTETDDEKAVRKARETLALPAPRLALPEHADAIDIEAEPVTDDTTDEPATHQIEFTLCD